MGYIRVQQDRIDNIERILSICPFGAIELQEGNVCISAGCRFCQLCLKDSSQAFVWEEDQKEDTSHLADWKDIAVFAEWSEGKLHPVTLELIGKARELADQCGQRVVVVIVGSADIGDCIEELTHYGADEIVVYRHPQFRFFRIEPYATALTDFINAYKPSVFLVGATVLGRSLAPRLAARFQTGLTADCTELRITPSGELVQIRPAFGGNIMAQIRTAHHRPQLATVRYKVFSTPVRNREPLEVTVTERKMRATSLRSAIRVLSQHEKPAIRELTEAEIIVVAGRGIKSLQDMDAVYQLADLLGGTVAGTRPLIEAGWLESHLQIGLSGRTVSPKLLITLGVSGAVQFAAGIGGAECIVSVNNDPDAPIFRVADYGLVGDVSEVLSALLTVLGTR